MAQEYFEHKARPGDRWDLIAYEYYGDATLLRPLLLANPKLVGRIEKPVPLVFERTTVIKVPVLPEEEISAAQLPPWKRK